MALRPVEGICHLVFNELVLLDGISSQWLEELQQILNLTPSTHRARQENGRSSLFVSVSFHFYELQLFKAGQTRPNHLSQTRVQIRDDILIIEVFEGCMHLLDELLDWDYHGFPAKFVNCQQNDQVGVDECLRQLNEEVKYFTGLIGSDWDFVVYQFNCVVVHENAHFIFYLVAFEVVKMLHVENWMEPLAIIKEFVDINWSLMVLNNLGETPLRQENSDQGHTVIG